MKSGWVGNVELQAMVAARDGGVALHPEIVAVTSSDVRVTPSQWAAGSATGGSIEFLASGGARLASTATSLIPATTNDGTNSTALSHIAPFDAVLVEWLDSGAEDREIHNLVARLDPRRDGGQPKTVAFFAAALFRVAEIREESDGLVYVLEQLGPAPVIAATGEAAADFTFNFQGFNGAYPIVGQRPTGPGPDTRRPLTLIRITALRSDGTVADNVTWLSDSVEAANKTDGAIYSATHYTVEPIAGLGHEEVGGNAFFISTEVASFPEFTLNRAAYDTGAIEFASAVDFNDQPGTGDLVIVARGETPSNSVLTFEIDDGGGYVECFDGDIIGADNTAQGGADLSGVSTTGPWDMQVTLTPSTAADLNSPVVRAIGIERIASTFLTGAAYLDGGHRQIDPVTLKGNIASAELVVLKTGEPDFRDYGSNILASNHIGDIEVRFWLADVGRTVLPRSQWLRHSVWDVEDYVSDETAHSITIVSPLHRLRNVIIPPFVVTTGSDGTRTAVQVDGSIQEAYDEIIDGMLGIPARLRGASPDDDTNQVSKIIERSDAKDELDRLAYLSGGSIIDTQGPITFVKVMRDSVPGDVPVARFPLGSYRAGAFGPGYSTRTDEFFVPYNWNVNTRSFEDERRYLNAIALDKLGGVGLNTTQILDEETAKWITTQTLADLVGDRVPNHFATGQIIFPIHSHERHPELELGDCVWIETTRFVARSPLNNQEIRGRVATLAIVTQIRDPWGQDLELWVPSFEHIIVDTGTVTPQGFANPGILHVTASERDHPGSTGAPVSLQSVSVPPLFPTANVVSVRAVISTTGAGDIKQVTVAYDNLATHSAFTIPTGDQSLTVEVLIQDSGGGTGFTSTVVQPAEFFPPRGGNVADTDEPQVVDIYVELFDGGDTATLEFSEVTWLGEAA